MPKGHFPDTFNDLLESTILVTIATVDPENRPQVNPSWFLFAEGKIWLSLTPDKKKYWNLRKNPHIALCFIDASNPQRYLEVRGTVSEIVEDTGNAIINRIARKYTGADWAFGVPGEKRLKTSIDVESWTTM